MLTIAIADHHVLCRETFCRYVQEVEPGIVLKGFSHYDDMAEYLLNDTPDFLLIEHNLPGWDGAPLRGKIIKGSATRIGVLLPFPDIAEVDAKKDFFDGYFPKTLSAKEILAGIQKVRRGEAFYPAVKNDNQHGNVFLTSAAPEKCYSSLTMREKEVLTFLLKGASNKEIARALDLQVVTIKLHVRGICRKFSAANRTQAALIAKESGY